MESWMSKRIFDFTSALIGLLVLAPLLGLIALTVKLSSPGPVLYRQARVGFRQRLFRLAKFRTMVCGADRLGTSVTTSDDSRTTNLGRFLRRTKLDELPQLWNVLNGDMSLVGPRPEVPEIVAAYAPWMLQIFAVRPGITSIASLHLRHEEELLALVSSPDEVYAQILVPAKIELALPHVQNQSFAFDLKILLLTVWTLLTKAEVRGQRSEPDILTSVIGTLTSVNPSHSAHLIARIMEFNRKGNGDTMRNRVP
jgi:lipopolysaccharide/colanic/teichoic acid biosynthesis glycosyltransferase